MSRDEEIAALSKALREHVEWQAGFDNGALPGDEDFEKQGAPLPRSRAATRSSAAVPVAAVRPVTASAPTAPRPERARPTFLAEKKPGLKRDVAAKPEVEPIWKRLGATQRVDRVQHTPESVPEGSSAEPTQGSESAPERPQPSAADSGTDGPPRDDAPPPAGEWSGGSLDDAPPAGRAAPRPVATSAVTSAPASASATKEVMSAEQKLAWLKDYLGDCRRCPLHEGRTNVVFGTGSARARVMFVGEAPGANEDEQGVPFVGPAGELLDRMIVAMGLSRDEVYIANVLKCRPPNNRDPGGIEVKQCAPFLKKEIDVVQPEVLVALGRFAAVCLLDRDESMRSLRGRWHQFDSIPVMATYHPAYLLRSPQAKRDVWSDLQLVMKRLA